MQWYQVDMSIKRIIVCLLVLCSSFAFSQKKLPAYDFKKTYSATDLQFDLSILKEALVKVHPGLYWYQSEKEFEAAFSAVKDSVSTPKTEFEFYNLLLPLIADIKCSHTDLAPSVNFDKKLEKEVLLFPFATNVIDGKSYILRNYTSDTMIAIGSEISTINGVDCREIIKRFSAQTWADGYTKNFYRLDDNFPIALLHQFNFPAAYDVVITDAAGNSKELHVPAITYPEAYKIYLKRYPPTKTNSFYSVKYLDSSSTAVLRLDAFMGKKYKKFLAETFKTIREKKIDHLIIDLRNNPGGMDDYGRLLYQYIALKPFKYYSKLEITLDDPADTIYKYAKLPGLKVMFKPKYTVPAENGTRLLLKAANGNISDIPFEPLKDNFKGSVYVLIDEASFSASSEFCAVTHYLKRATFIGRPTGGAYGGNSSGSECSLTLPKTGIRVVIPVVRYFSAVECQLGQSIVPDHEIKKSPAHLDKKTDQEMKLAMELISKERNQK